MRAAFCLWMFLLLAAEAASAAEIHRCRQPDGVIAFQSTPCAAGAIALGATPVSAAKEHPDATRAAREERKRIDAWSRQSTGRLAPSLGGREARAPAASRSSASAPRRSGAAGGNDAAAHRCSEARAAREAAYRRDGNRMGFDRRRELQDGVTAACGLR